MNGAPTQPSPGRLHQVRAGAGGLLATVGNAFGLGAGAARLAARNPAGALNNADNYGYYVMGFE